VAAGPDTDASSQDAGASRSAMTTGSSGDLPRAVGNKRGLVVTLLLLAIFTPFALLSPWTLSVCLILGCGTYVAFEFALVKVSLHKLERDVEAGVAGAGVVLRMKREMNSMLAASQFGITVTSLGLTLALEPAIHHALVDYERVAAFSAALAMGLGAILHVTFGEQIPKGIALVVPVKVLYYTAPFMRMFRWVAVPFIKTCNSVANLVVQGVTGRHPDTAAHHEENVDIGQALFYAYSAGELKPQQLRLMRNVLAFADRTVREAMTPARLVVYLDLRKSWQDNMAIADEHGFSRLPVVDGDQHNVVGYARRADLLQAELRGQRDLKLLVRQIERRPETASLGRLNLFRGSPMIAVFDEHDSFTGLLTAEDIVEQIVGEIYDETDDRPAKPDVEALSDGSMRVAGTMLLAPAGEALGLGELDEHQDVDTVGGLVLKLLGRQPKAGDEVDLDGYQVIVEAAQGFRITSLLFSRRAEPEDEAEAPSPAAQA
jgi:CBS domain containing-hemolysin-like protein